MDKAYYKKPTYLLVWIHILLSANHGAKEFMWNGSTIIIKEGQFITGRKELAEQTGIPETTIERILNYLESEHQIEQQKTTKYRLITVLNWKDYQQADGKVDNKRTTNGQQADTNKNDKNEKNEKNISSTVETVQGYSSLGAEIIKAFIEVDPKNKTYYGNTTQRKACDFLIEQYGLDEVLKRISVLPKTNKASFFPTITTPAQLRDKWVQLEHAVERKRGELSEKKTKIAFI